MNDSLSAGAHVRIEQIATLEQITGDLADATPKDADELISEVGRERVYAIASRVSRRSPPSNRQRF
jgi:hypothetical protein